MASEEQRAHHRLHGDWLRLAARPCVCVLVVCQAYREIAEQRRSKSSQYSNVQNQIVQKKKIKRRSELCLAEVQALPEETVSYKAVGRMSVNSSGRKQHDTTLQADRPHSDAHTCNELTVCMRVCAWGHDSMTATDI